MRFDALIDRFPREGAEAARRFQALVEGEPSAEFTFAHLVHELDPIPDRVLALMLALLQSEGVVRRVVRVQSRIGRAGIGDFGSISDVPSELPDSFTDTTVEVTPDDLLIVYRFEGG